MKKIITVFLMLILTLSLFAEAYPDGAGNSVSYGESLSNQNVAINLIFNLKDSQLYEFGFTDSSSNVSLDTKVTPIESIELMRDYDREIPSTEETTGTGIVASASFKAYWKIISGYNLDLYISSSGKFVPTDTTSTSTETIEYSLYDSNNNVVLGEGRVDSVSDNYKSEYLLSSHRPDYKNYQFSSAASFELDLVTKEDLTHKFDSVKSYSTTFTLSVEVL